MCEHNTTIVKYDQGNVQVEICTWGCGQTIISVKGADAVTESFTAAELSALRARVEALEAADKSIGLLFADGFSVNLRVVKGGDVVAECHDYSDPLEHRKTYGRGVSWKEAVVAALK